MINAFLTIYAYALLVHGVFFAMTFVYKGMTRHLRR